jgi:hypothetical protein
VRRYAVRLAVAVLVAAAVGLGAPGPARAATCGTAQGVSVVVDFHQLGGLETACDAGGGGKTAATQMADVGHTLTYVQRQPGFVCRVDGKPKDDPCVNTPPSDAYWSLWWSDGSDTWTYATTGVDSLTVPDGGSVALAWDGKAGDVSPSAAPRAGGASTALARPAASDRATDPADGGLPGWVAPSAIGLLLAAAAGTAVVRRRRGATGP